MYTCLFTDDYEPLESEDVLLGPSAVVGYTRCLIISLRRDEVTEPVETFSVTLSAVSPVVVLGSYSVASVTILDDDSESIGYEL